MIRFCLALVLLLAGAMPLHAQNLPLPLPDADHAEWQAIGRVNIRGYNRRGMCSGTLIASDRVLTAAHCVLRGGRVVRTSDIVFVAGWHRGAFVAAAEVARVALFPEVRAGDLTPPRDLAVLHLDQPLDIPPIPLATARPAGPYAMLGYLGTRPHVLSASYGCTATWGAMLRLPCPTVPGNSGGPIIAFGRAGPQVVAVVSQTSRRLSLSTPIDVLPDH